MNESGTGEIMTNFHALTWDTLHPYQKAVYGKPICRKDRNGREIKYGEIVKFKYDPDWPNNRRLGAIMVDLVLCHNNLPFFFCQFGGMYAWRVSDRCEVIGNLKENPELLK